MKLADQIVNSNTIEVILEKALSGFRVAASHSSQKVVDTAAAVQTLSNAKIP